MKRARRTLSLLVLTILLVLGPVLAMLATPIPLAVRLLVAFFILAGTFFLLILGRDFFIEYSLRIILAILMIYGVALLSMWAMHASHPGENKPPVVNAAAPGTLLVLFLAVVTVLGFSITLIRLQEAHIRISTYDRFLARVELLLTEIDRQANAGGFTRSLLEFFKLRRPDQFELKILCTVPTLGNVTHHEAFYPTVYRYWLKIARDPDIAVELVCLDPSSPDGNRQLRSLDSLPPLYDKSQNIRRYSRREFEEGTGDDPRDQRNHLRDELLETTAVGKFYATFLDRGFSREAVRRGLCEALEIIDALRVSEAQNQIWGMPWPIEPKEPPLHLFWTKRRAIVAVPLDRGLKRTEGKKVTLIGYETTDPEVLSRLAEVFDEWRQTIEDMRLLRDVDEMVTLDTEMAQEEVAK